MNRRYEDIWDELSGEEVAGPGLEQVDGESECLLNAWYRERSQRIETSLVLEEVRRLLRRLVATRELDDAPAREARRLLRAIRGLKDNFA